LDIFEGQRISNSKKETYLGLLWEGGRADYIVQISFLLCACLKGIRIPDYPGVGMPIILTI
jgi:hypothetical protein